MLFRYISIAAVGVAAVYLALPFTDTSAPVVTIRADATNSPVRPGGQLSIRTIVRRWKSCPVQIDRVIFDNEKTRWVLPDLDWKGSPGPMGEDEYTSKLQLPVNIAQGPARYLAISSYTCNWTHRLLGPIVVASPEVHFEVKGTPDTLPLPAVGVTHEVH